MHLRNLWYHVLPSRRLKPGTMHRRVLLDEPVLIGRTQAGEAFALRDLCPHRGVPLSAGAFDAGAPGGGEIECPYHGWRFAPDGQCTAIPSLVDGAAFEVNKIRVRTYRVAEVQGNLWIYMAGEGAAGDAAPALAPPEMPLVGARRPNLVVTLDFACGADHAVLGLIDPAHGPYVHRSWFWRSKRSIHEKAKRFAPAPLGFTMVSHKPSRNSLAYRLLGGDLETEITFTLPGQRVELVRAGRHALVGLTTITPTTQERCTVSQIFYWTMPWLSLLKPVLMPFARYFLSQDQGIFGLQGENTAFDPRAMYIDDADTQIKWYYRLKREWAEAIADDRPFVNPLAEATLRWRT